MADDLAEIRRNRAGAWRLSREVGAQSEHGHDSEKRPTDSAPLPESAGSALTATGEVHDGVTASTGEMSTQDASPSEIPCCRICFDGEESNENGRLFSPCKCTGTMKFVHVECLNRWRAASTSATSFYKCDACHYEYRLERVRIASLLLSKRLHAGLAVTAFVIAALGLGGLCQWLRPELLDYFVEWLQPHPSVRQFLVAGKDSKGNPACWHSGFTYGYCCQSEGGNPDCWDSLHSYDGCCTDTSDTFRRALRVLVPVVQVLCSGSLALSAVGFLFYVRRVLRENWREIDGRWHIFWHGAWFASLGSQELSRVAAITGVAMALVQLYETLGEQAKWAATRCHERLLEVN